MDQQQDFGLDVAVTEAETVVHLRGELDLRSAPHLRRRLVEEATPRCTRLVLDLAALSFMDSSGLGVLVAAVRAMHSHGGELVLRDPSPVVLKILEISGLTSVLPVLSTTAD